MARTDTLPHFLTDVADAIRTKKGTSETIKASDFDTEIENLPSGGGLDWSAIGYDGIPQAIKDGYDYAVEIKNNWTPATSLQSKFENDKKLFFMPLVDTSQATNMNFMFINCSSLVNVPILNTINATSMQYTFQKCANLKSIPLLNTSKVNNMKGIFYDCSELENIPLLNTSSITSGSGFQNFCSGCLNLTDTSLDNILQMCINATSYGGTKTLVRLGFTSTGYPASRIQALPHYQDFIDAGWTIGY